MKHISSKAITALLAALMVFSLPVSTVIVGCDTVAQLEENVKLARIALESGTLLVIDYPAQVKNHEPSCSRLCRAASSACFLITMRIAVRAACVIPGIRSAWPTVDGSTRESFTLSSLESPGTVR